MPTYLAFGIGAGIVFAGAYAVEASRRKISPKLDDAVLIVISSVGLAVGGRVVYICFSNHNLGPFHGDDAVYICLGGFALVWVSIAQLRNGIFGPKREHELRAKAAKLAAAAKPAVKAAEADEAGA